MDQTTPVAAIREHIADIYRQAREIVPGAWFVCVTYSAQTFESEPRVELLWCADRWGIRAGAKWGTDEVRADGTSAAAALVEFRAALGAWDERARQECPACHRPLAVVESAA